MSRGYRVSGGGTGGGDGPDLTDGFTIGIGVADSNAAPTDDATYAMALTQADTVPGQTEAVSLTFPAGVWAETQPPPTDANSFAVRVWLSGSAGTGVTAAANANGQNNGTIATLRTQVAGTNPIVMTSTLGANIPGGVTLGSCVYLGWFRSENEVTTSFGRIIARSTTGLFPDITIFNNSTFNTNVDNLTSPHLFNLVPAGVDTLAKAQTLQIIHTVQDIAPGVTPHVLTVDAGAISISGAFT